MTMKTKKDTATDTAQSARFIEVARELGCDESPDAFAAAMKKVARHKPVKKVLTPPPNRTQKSLGPDGT